MAFLRRLRDDARDYPATTALGAAWLVVFAAMVADQARSPEGLTRWGFVLGLGNGHRFGDLTLGELYGGQGWRTVTATFVHYGALHIAMNLFAFYQLGSLVESWYGSGTAVAIYVLTGGGGNLISALIRLSLRSSPSVSSAGGSTVVMGLVGLCAVVGWRARTAPGAQLRDQMLWVIGLTMALGFGLSAAGLPVIDNWGHVGGTLVGAAVGLANPTLLRLARGLPARGAGCVGLCVLVACASAQVVDDRDEAARRKQAVADAVRRFAADERLIFRLDEVRELYQAVAAPRVLARGTYAPRPSRREAAKGQTPKPSLVPPRSDAEELLYHDVLAAALRSLDTMAGAFDPGPAAPEFRRARALLAASVDLPPTASELHEFQSNVTALLIWLRRDRDAARAVVNDQVGT